MKSYIDNEVNWAIFSDKYFLINMMFGSRTSKIIGQEKSPDIESLMKNSPWPSH